MEMFNAKQLNVMTSVIDCMDLRYVLYLYSLPVHLSYGTLTLPYPTLMFHIVAVSSSN